MKKLLLAFLLSHALCGYAQKIDTLYYDQSWKGVEHADFATFYRVVVYPSSPNYPTRFKDFYMNGTLQAEGVIEAVDAFDDANSKFKKTIAYYDNGTKAGEFNFENGVYHGIQTEYHPTGNIAWQGSYNHGKLEGTYVEYTAAGNVLREGVVENDLYTGPAYHYVNEVLVTSAYIDKGVIHGKVSNYSNGRLLEETMYNHGVQDGLYCRYNENGIIVEKTNYVNGLPLGTQEDRTGGIIQTCVLKQVQSNGTLPVRISATLKQGALATKAVAKANTAGAILGTIAGALTNTITEAETGVVERYTYFDYIDLNIFNDSDNEYACNITDVTVQYIKKGKYIRPNSAMSHSGFTNIFSSYAKAQEVIAETEAAEKAAAAASVTSSHTQVSNAYSHQESQSSANANVRVNANGSYNSAGAAASVAYGANNSGNAAGVYREAVGAYSASGKYNANGKYSANTNSESSQYGSTYGASSAKSKDGFLEYQIYQAEKAKADAAINKAQNDAARFAEYADYSSFRISSKTNIEKWIGVYKEKKYDMVRVFFRVNGIDCFVEF